MYCFFASAQKIVDAIYILLLVYKFKTNSADDRKEPVQIYLLNGLVKPIFNPVLIIGILPTPRFVIGSFR